MLGPGQKSAPLHPKGPTYNQARGEYEAGQEGRHDQLGKARGPLELRHVVPPPELTQVPLLPPLPLAGLA